MELPKAWVNASMLAQFIDWLICFVGRLEKIHLTGKMFIPSAGEGKNGTIELMEPLDEEISGTVEVVGRVKAKATTMLHHADVQLKEESIGDCNEGTGWEINTKSACLHKPGAGQVDRTNHGRTFRKNDQENTSRRERKGTNRKFFLEHGSNNRESVFLLVFLLKIVPLFVDFPYDHLLMKTYPHRDLYTKVYDRFIHEFQTGNNTKVHQQVTG